MNYSPTTPSRPVERSLPSLPEVLKQSSLHHHLGPTSGRPHLGLPLCHHSTVEKLHARCRDIAVCHGHTAFTISKSIHLQEASIPDTLHPDSEVMSPTWKFGRPRSLFYITGTEGGGGDSIQPMGTRYRDMRANGQLMEAASY